MSTAVAPSRPSSSAIAAKMKSFSTSGMRSGVPRPRPRPATPPSHGVPALDDLEAAGPSGSAHGFEPAVDPVLHVAERATSEKSAPAPNSSPPTPR